MRTVGKKGREWLRDRKKLIKEGLKNGRLVIQNGVIMGRDEDTGEWAVLTPDHVIKRSQGGSNEKVNIEWVSLKSHNERDNMLGSKKQKDKKAKWASKHKCKHCGARVSQLLCSSCFRLSL